MVRIPAVAGQFYPGNRGELLKVLESMIPDCSNKVDAVGCVVPHAGYIFSAHVAGEVYAKLKPKGTYIILSPNHTGYGGRFAFLSEQWSTPLGVIDTDRDLLAAITRNTDLIREDPAAHMAEHSIEVQLPFIQKTAPKAKIVPITMQHGNLSELREMADAIVSAINESGSDALIVASSDMTHYEHREVAKKKDGMAIKEVLDLDAEGFLDVVEKNNITMCGYIPTAIMLMCAKKMNAKKCELVKYSDSGDVTEDLTQVVGYAGIIVYRGDEHVQKT